jgi:hypothetical protein
VGHKEEDIDEEAQEADKKVEDADDEQHQQVPSRMGWAVEVGDDGENKHDQSQDGCNGVHNEKGRKGRPGRRGEVEVVGIQRS